jgi:hypothetical protein
VAPPNPAQAPFQVVTSGLSNHLFPPGQNQITYVDFTTSTPGALQARLNWYHPGTRIGVAFMAGICPGASTCFVPTTAQLTVSASGAMSLQTPLTSPVPPGDYSLYVDILSNTETESFYMEVVLFPS